MNQLISDNNTICWEVFIILIAGGVYFVKENLQLFRTMILHNPEVARRY